MGATLANAFHKLNAVGEITNGVSKRIASLSKGIFSNGATRGASLASAVVPSTKDYEKKVARINELASNPNALMDHLSKTTGSMYEAAPNISQSIHTTMVNSLQFLESKIPKPNNEMILSAKWEPSKSQKAQFNRYYTAVDDPTSVLKSVKSGTLSNEEMEALQACHPHLLQEMRSKVIEHLHPEKAKNMSYASKIALAKFLGEPLDEHMLPQVVAANQASFNGQQQQAPGAQGPAKKPSLGGLKQMKLASRSSTMTQDLEQD
jgi:hypothetical protein